jgi:hypothetical protein
VKAKGIATWLAHEADADKVSLTAILHANARANDFLKVTHKFLARVPDARLAPCLKNSRQGRIGVSRRDACRLAGSNEPIQRVHRFAPPFARKFSPRAHILLLLPCLSAFAPAPAAWQERLATWRLYLSAGKCDCLSTC